MLRSTVDDDGYCFLPFFDGVWIDNDAGIHASAVGSVLLHRGLSGCDECLARRYDTESTNRAKKRLEELDGYLGVLVPVLSISMVSWRSFFLSHLDSMTPQ